MQKVQDMVLAKVQGWCRRCRGGAGAVQATCTVCTSASIISGAGGRGAGGAGTPQGQAARLEAARERAKLLGSVQHTQGSQVEGGLLSDTGQASGRVGGGRGRSIGREW